MVWKLDRISLPEQNEMRTTKEIARQFGVSPKAILKCLRDNGVKIRSRWDYAKK